MAGFETSTSTLCHFIYSLAQNPSIQEKLIQEVDEYTKSNNSLYEIINQMTYLDLCLKETLRVFPSAVRIERKAVKNTKLGEILIPKDSYLTIPVYAVHRNPNNFENADQFIPERFSPENVHKIKSGTYLPFAVGPRNCIGMKFAQINIKISIYQILKKFRFVKSDEQNV